MSVLVCLVRWSLTLQQGKGHDLQPTSRAMAKKFIIELSETILHTLTAYVIKCQIRPVVSVTDLRNVVVMTWAYIILGNVRFSKQL